MTCNEPWASWSWRATACSARALPSPPPPSESCASHVSETALCLSLKAESARLPQICAALASYC